MGPPPADHQGFSGDMTTLLLLPGLLCDASVWRDQARALGAAADVRIADFSRLDSIAAMADEALAMAEGPVALAGHSMGARVAMEIWRKAPERIERLALLDTGTHPPHPGRAREADGTGRTGPREGHGGAR